MLTDKLGVGIIGSGFMATTYAEVLAHDASHARLIGVWGGKRAGDLATRYGVTAFSLESELVEDERVDVVLITTPQALHHQQALRAIDAGCHVMLEKPMAVTVAECDEILAHAERMNVKLSIGFTQRSRICNIRAKALLDGKILGPIQHIHSFQAIPNGVATLPSWQLLPENKGTLLGYGVHNIDLIRWLTGRDISTVQAICHSRTPDVPVETTSHLIMGLDDGTLATCDCSFDTSKPGFTRSSFGAWIVCEEGLIDLDAYGELRVAHKNGAWMTLATQPPIDWAGKGMLDPVRLESYTAHLRGFFECLLANMQPTITGWDGRQAVAVAAAAYESAATGNRINLIN